MKSHARLTGALAVALSCALCLPSGLACSLPAFAYADDGQGASSGLRENSWRYRDGNLVDFGESSDAGASAAAGEGASEGASSNAGAGAGSGSAAGAAGTDKDAGMRALSLDDEADREADQEESEEEDQEEAKAWTRTPDGYVNSQGEVIFGAMQRGIDVSEHQHEIDWEAVAQDDVSFVIIRCGYGDDDEDQDDKYWLENVKACKSLGIPFGVYLYSYAEDEQMAQSEVAHVLRLLEEAGVEPDDLALPVYYDLEDERFFTEYNENGVPSYTKTYAELRKLFAANAEVFCSALEEAGYVPGIYANLRWWNTLLTDEVFEQWDRWVAQYNVECDYEGSYRLWQATSSGVVEGIEGRVDVNFAMCPTGFYDVPADHWAAKEGWIKRAVRAGLMSGYRSDEGVTTGLFGPDVSLTRGEMATVIYRLANPGSSATTDASAYERNETSLVDNTDEQFFTAAINWAFEQGIMTGDTDAYGVPLNTARPYDPIEREEVATILYRYAMMCGADVSGAHVSSFAGAPDAWAVMPFAAVPMGWCYSAGVLTGDAQTGELMPLQQATRAQIAKMVAVVVELMS